MLPRGRLNFKSYNLVTADNILISDYDYDLPETRIAKFPLESRQMSKLLVSRSGAISETHFADIGALLPAGTLLVFNNTKVIRARIIMHKPSGARIEVFCLEPHAPADYERAFAVKGECEWKCIVGNSKKWKDGALTIPFEYEGSPQTLRAYRIQDGGREQTVRLEWSGGMTFGELLEYLGRMPIPPYLGRESEEIDNSRYQTVYSKFEGSVAAPTAGLHFTRELMAQLGKEGVAFGEVTLHVGAGTFLPVKCDEVARHHMHTEHFEVTAALLESLVSHTGKVAAVGTTTVRTLESLTALGYRVMQTGDPDAGRPMGQWELYDIPAFLSGRELLILLLEYMRRSGIEKLRTATQIMIMPGYTFRVADMIITNFHQPRSTLLLLVSAFVGEHWREIYDYAMRNDFRFLSYGDSSIMIP